MKNKADDLAKLGAKIATTGLEPIVRIFDILVYNELETWIANQHIREMMG